MNGLRKLGYTPAALQKCVQELARLSKYGLSDMKDSEYFAEVRRIYELGRTVRNFDQEVTFRWQGQDFPGLIRAHSFEVGLEIELWLPGVIAADVGEMFNDGREGFFCGFMPPSYYD